MRILVTGGAGYIGSVVTHRLVEAGHEVVVLDDLSTGYAGAVPAGVEFHKASIHQVAEVLTPSSSFDGVMHLAAKIEVAESVSRPAHYWDVNVSGTMALLAAVRAAGTPRVIFSSTGSMYRAGTDGPLTEESPLAPTNPYSASKLAVDLMLAGFCQAYRIGATSLRFFNASGAVGTLGERHEPESHLIPIVLQTAAGQREELMLYGDDYPTPDGTCVRDYIHVSDLALAHLLSLEAIEPGRHEVFNLGNGHGYSNKQVIDTVGEVSGRHVPVRVAPRRAGDFMISVASSEKARRVLGWVPERPALRDIVADAWAFHTAVYGVS
jgi:UDP-glucose 4-epimerase